VLKELHCEHFKETKMSGTMVDLTDSDYLVMQIWSRTNEKPFVIHNKVCLIGRKKDGFRAHFWHCPSVDRKGIQGYKFEEVKQTEQTESFRQ